MSRYGFPDGEGDGVDSENAAKNEIMMGLADRPGGDMTARLLLALTVLYTEKPVHSPEEQQQYVELALRLIDRVNVATRETVAGILRGHAAAPAEVLRRLDVSPSRADVEPDRTAAVEIATAAPAGPVAMPAEPAIASAATQAVPDDAQLGDAFFAAPAAERRRLLSLLAPDPGAVAEAVNLPATPGEAQRFYADLDTAALEGRIGEFIREFERRLALPKSLCERIVNDPSGELMAVAARAANMPIAVLQRVLLLVNPAVSHSVQRVYDLTDLYHGLDRGAAIRLLAMWRAQAKPNDTTAGLQAAAERKSAGLRDFSSAGLRSRFGALTARVQGQPVSPRSDPESAARRDLRSR
jgi:hypothetical protein